jgi:signal transduction histidine kinase
VPLLAHNDVIGVLHVGSLTHRRFGADDVELLSLVAGRVGVAVERAQIHAQSLSFDELKSNFVAIASHELRTPASAVYGVFATLVGREELPAETREALVRMGYEQAERLRRLIEQLLDLSQLDSGRITVDRIPVVLHSVLEDIIATAVPHDTDVRLEVSPGLTALVDLQVLERILSNLLMNATHYGSSPIAVLAEERDGHISIAVEDSGPGVPEHLRDSLFDRFVRGDDVRGSGLGLTIARAYAFAHGGDLTLAPGDVASRFELILPRD